MIADKINKYLDDNELRVDELLLTEMGELASYSFKRQFMEKNERNNEGKLYLSASGKCARQLAYGYHNYTKKGKEIDARAKVNFFMGDLIEASIVTLAKLAGCGVTNTGLDQLTCTFKLKGLDVQGHPDGIVDYLGRKLLLEVKSMTSFGFRKFENGEIDDGYLTQINMYMECLDLNSCCLVAWSKDSGTIKEKVFQKDESVVEFARENMQSVVDSLKGNLPDGRFEADKKGFYPWNCLYCGFWEHCKPNAEKIVKSGRYKLKEKE